MPVSWEGVPVYLVFLASLPRTSRIDGIENLVRSFY